MHAGYAIIVAAGECDCTEADLIAAADGLRSIGVTVAAVSLGETNIASLEAFASIGADGTLLVFANDVTNANFFLVAELNRVMAGIGALQQLCLCIQEPDVPHHRAVQPDVALRLLLIFLSQRLKVV